MAKGRRDGDTPGTGPRRRGSVPNEERLRALGSEASAPPKGPVANEDRLLALGSTIDGKGGRRAGRRRWSGRRKIITGFVSIVVLAALLAGGAYGYARYEWDQVKKIDCTTCETAATDSAGDAPYNILLVGSDSRVGNTGQAAKSFGTASEVGGQRSDTIKILHVDPQAGTAILLSIPRDTYVEMSGLPQSSGLTGAQKINTAFNNGPLPLIQTIERTFGIPISHFVVVDFGGLINAVDALGGIKMNFNYAVRDDDNGNNNSGLDVPATGCQVLNGNEALALARSRYFEYYNPTLGEWLSDPSSDLGRIQRQDELIDAILSKAESTYNPLTLHSFIDSVVHDIEVDQGMTLGQMYDLAERYHAFSSTKLVTLTLPTVGETTDYGSDVEIVQEPAAQEMIASFLGQSPAAVSTPPLDVDGYPMSIPSLTTTTLAPSAPSTAAGSGSTSTAVAGPAAGPTTTTTTLPSYDPTPC